MEQLYVDLQKRTTAIQEGYLPSFFRLIQEDDRRRLNELLHSEPELTVSDQISGQLQELIKGRYPRLKLKVSDYPTLIESHTNGTNLFAYGVWVYYP